MTLFLIATATTAALAGLALLAPPPQERRIPVRVRDDRYPPHRR